MEDLSNQPLSTEKTQQNLEETTQNQTKVVNLQKAKDKIKDIKEVVSRIEEELTRLQHNTVPFPSGHFYLVGLLLELVGKNETFNEGITNYLYGEYFTKLQMVDITFSSDLRQLVEEVMDLVGK